MTDNRYYEYFRFGDWVWWSPEMLADALAGWTPVEPQLSLVDYVAANYRHHLGNQRER